VASFGWISYLVHPQSSGAITSGPKIGVCSTFYHNHLLACSPAYRIARLGRPAPASATTTASRSQAGRHGLLQRAERFVISDLIFSWRALEIRIRAFSNQLDVRVERRVRVPDRQVERCLDVHTSERTRSKDAGLTNIFRIRGMPAEQIQMVAWYQTNPARTLDRTLRDLSKIRIILSDRIGIKDG